MHDWLKEINPCPSANNWKGLYISLAKDFIVFFPEKYNSVFRKVYLIIMMIILMIITKNMIILIKALLFNMH